MSVVSEGTVSGIGFWLLADSQESSSTISERGKNRYMVDFVFSEMQLRGLLHIFLIDNG